MAIEIQLRRDTADNWNNNNPVLADGEIGYIKGTHNMKVGDGSTSWKDLKLMLTQADWNETDTINNSYIKNKPQIISPELIDDKGDLLVGRGNNSIERLGTGTNGQILVADNNKSAGMEWKDPDTASQVQSDWSEDDSAKAAYIKSKDLVVEKNIVDSKGDLIVATDDNSVARLPVGSNNQFLVADDSEANGMKWTDKDKEWNYVHKDADYTAIEKDYVWCDTKTNGAFTLTLPASPNYYDKVYILDAKSNFDNDNLTVARNGNYIMGLDEDMVISDKNSNLSLIFYNGDWRINE